jgi:hypothetical protein
MSYLVFEIVVNQYVQILEFLLFRLRNFRFMVKAWVNTKNSPNQGDLKNPFDDKVNIFIGNTINDLK